jgi:hypothetical protein
MLMSMPNSRRLICAVAEKPAPPPAIRREWRGYRRLMPASLVS